MGSEEVGTLACTRCGVVVSCSKVITHYIYNAVGAKHLCFDCEKEFREFKAKFFLKEIK